MKNVVFHFVLRSTCTNFALKMKNEWFIARRLQLGGGGGGASPSLNVALAGIVLAVVVMILSIAVVTGFKSEISNKIYALDPHMKVWNGVVGLDDNYSTVDGREVMEAIAADSSFVNKVESMSLIADKPAVLKTEDDFMGIQLKGVGPGYDWSYIERHLDAGRVPHSGDTAINEIVMSRTTARQLRLAVGDRVPTYFIDNKVKVRNTRIVGIFNTDFDSFDKAFIIGNIALVQQVNGWNADTGNYVGVNVRHMDKIGADAYELYSLLARDTYLHERNTLYVVNQTHTNNAAFFSWLSMLDMNVVVILVLMMVVAGFTIVSALLMIVLERIKMIGMLKALGSTNGSIRQIFIALTAKLIVKALVMGNVIGLGLALLQKHLHIMKLDPDAYYMPYVPIELNVGAVVVLNVGILLVSYLTLLGPSHIVSTIKPTATMRFE